jgi:hypothetical protein
MREREKERKKEIKKIDTKKDYQTVCNRRISFRGVGVVRDNHPISRTN